MNHDPEVADLIEQIRPLTRRIRELQEQMKAQGMHGNDRELLTCPRCGLMEDVTAAGLLITCRNSDPGQDTGLRFEPVTGESYRCPSCGQTVQEPLSDDEMQEGLTA